MANLDNMFKLADVMSQDTSMKPLIDSLTSIMELPEEAVNDASVDIIVGMIRGGFTPQLKQQAIESLMNEFEEAQYTKAQAKQMVEELHDGLDGVVAEFKPSEQKKKILDGVLDIFYEIFDSVLEHYHSYDFELPIMLEEGAQLPTYAHDDDAAADLYALEDTVVRAHTISNKIHTGVHLQLPENWKAHIAPRSSIGAKTPLRLSNMLGLIDPSYTGELIVLFDNISNEDYTIHAGDRIAQMWVEPVHRFMPYQVNELKKTERGDGGLGSTGK